MKTWYVRVVIGLIIVNAAFAVFVLLRGEIGDTEGKILGTSLVATASAVLAMTCAPARAAGRLGPVPLTGMLAAAAGFAAVTVVIWGEVDEVWIGKVAGSAFIIAVASALACLLSAWPIEGRSAWVGVAANLLIAGVGGMLLFALWFEVGSSGYWRGFSVLAVLLAAAALAVPVLHRGGPEATREPIRHCPFCGSTIEGVSGRPITCPSCSRHYTVNQPSSRSASAANQLSELP